MEEKKLVNYDEFAHEYVEGVKKCNEAPTWGLVETAYVAGAMFKNDVQAGKDWHDRLIDEHHELKGRYLKLAEFMQTEEFHKLSENYKTVMQNQKIAMEMYLQQLNLRLYGDLDDDTKQVPNIGMLGMIAGILNNPWSSPGTSSNREKSEKE